MSSDPELDDIRRKRLQELRRQLAEDQSQSQQQVEFDKQKQSLLRQIMMPEARERLARIRLVKPEFVEQLELQLIQAAQSGKIRLPITDELLKELLTKLQTQQRGISVRGL
ncbi:DNA-binding protein [Candidatus Bathyarchaeota archaeon]|nr:DNA-binding protein [Candidatus Bathyarchaeota archaeon]